MFLPTTIKEVRERGWDQLDVILFSGDAYIDHPAFGAAVVGRLLEAEGYRVAIVPQPNWRDDLRDFRKLGAPRLFFGISGGSMDSMVNHYTANLRLRHDDAYTPGGKAGFRPDRAVTVYSQILKRLYPHVPVVIGGIEASLRRLTHYDYWSDALKPSILAESGADLLIYGMGERVVQQVARAMRNGYNAKLLRKIRQVAFLSDESYVARLDPAATIRLRSYEECLADKTAFGENFTVIETQSNLMEPTATLVEAVGDRCVVVTPANTTLTTEELDHSFDLPYERAPHPRYAGKGDIPACYSIYSFMLNKPAELGSIRTDGFMLFMDFLLYGNGADKFTAMTSLGKTKLDLDQDGTAETDAEVLLLLDNRGNVWTFQIYDGIDYSNTTGKYEIAKSNLTSAFKMYFMGDNNGTPLCSMVPTTVNGQLALYLSYFTGKANELYRLTYDSAKNFWTGEKLASFGENVYPATILKIDNHEANQTELEQIVSNLPLGSHTVQSQDLTDMLNSAAVEETAASYGALNTAAEKTASAKPAADIASEQTASSEIITSEDQNTVTLKLVPGGTAPTTNGLMSVSYDAAGWELKNVIGNAQYFSYKAEAGKVTLGYVSVDSMPAGEQVAELTFTKTNAGKDADPRFTVQKTERNEQRIDEVEHLTASSNRDDPCPSKEFRDLSTTAWYHESVDYVLSKGIMQGYGDGTFRPDETATRAQVVTLLYRIAGEPAVDDSKALPFTDVNLESWYGSALRWAYQNGITTGVSADTFAPDDCVTREQMVSFLARYAKVTGAYEKVSEDLSSFSDRDRVSSYAVESMQWAVANGLILGTETGKLEPMATATRAQLAAVVARYCQSIH